MVVQYSCHILYYICYDIIEWLCRHGKSCRYCRYICANFSGAVLIFFLFRAVHVHKMPFPAVYSANSYNGKSEVLLDSTVLLASQHSAMSQLAQYYELASTVLLASQYSAISEPAQCYEQASTMPLASTVLLALYQHIIISQKHRKWSFIIFWNFTQFCHEFEFVVIYSFFCANFSGPKFHLCNFFCFFPCLVEV